MCGGACVREREEKESRLFPPAPVSLSCSVLCALCQEERKQIVLAQSIQLTQLVPNPKKPKDIIIIAHVYTALYSLQRAPHDTHKTVNPVRQASYY